MNKELTPMDILKEHLPQGTSMLIVGPPGSGKTVLSQHLVYEALKRDTSAIYIAPSSQIELIVSNKELFTWDVSSFLEENQLGVVEIGDVADPTELNICLTQAIRDTKQPLSMVALDSLTVLTVGMEQRKIMKFTEALTRKLQDQKVTLLLLTTPTKSAEDLLTKMKSLAFSVIEIKLEEKGTIKRYMRIFKFMRRSHSTQWYPFEITDDGILFAAPAAPAGPSEEEEEVEKEEEKGVGVEEKVEVEEKVRCEHCGMINPKGASVCAGCNQPLAPSPAPGVCPGCGCETNPPTARFCINCGTELPGEPAPAPAPAPKPVRPPTVKVVLSSKREILLSGPETIIGREDFQQDLSPEEAKFISREHVTLTCEDDTYYILDKKSTNGTRVNGVLITGKGKKELNNNDKITLADTVTVTFYMK